MDYLFIRVVADSHGAPWVAEIGRLQHDSADGRCERMEALVLCLFCVFALLILPLLSLLN